MALDLYLSATDDHTYDAIKGQIYKETYTNMPLLSWDVYSEGYAKAIDNAQREQDIMKVKTMAEKLSWKNDINDIFVNQDFEAILVTDIHQRIIWVNEGFTTMSGYSKSDALDRTPAFLQGAGTSKATKTSIKLQLKSNKPFTEVITNYRKNGEPYECEVKIFPLYNNETTHFMALERQVG